MDDNILLPPNAAQHQSVVGGIGSIMTGCAQLWNAAVNERRLHLDRQSFKQRDEHFYANIANQNKMRLADIKARRDDLEYKKQLDDWPLPMSPIPILEHHAYSPRGLNIIMVVTANGDDDTYNESKRLLTNQPFYWSRQAEARFGGGIKLYLDQSDRRPRHTGTSLCSTLWSLLKTVPTVLIELNVVERDRYDLWLSTWGSAFEAEGRGEAKPPSPPLPPIPLDFTRPDDLAETLQRTRHEGAMTMALSSLIVGLGDVYRAIQAPYEQDNPVFPWLLSVDPQSACNDDMFKESGAYLKVINQIANYSPFDASEIAAVYAIAAYDAGLINFATMLIEKAILLSPLAQELKPSYGTQFQQVVEMLATCGKGAATPKRLRAAIFKIYGVDLGTSARSSFQPVDPRLFGSTRIAGQGPK